MRIIFNLLLTITLSAGAAFAQNKVTGFIYNDANKNRKKEASEKGIPNVAITNGINVTVTDAKGKYILPIWDDAIVSVVKPSGFAVPVNEYNQPQFFYVHNPKGSPSSKYKGIAPTGPLPKSVDFALTPSSEQDRFRALIFGDPQVLDEREVGYFEKGIVSEVLNVKDVAFGLTLGDLAGNDLALHKPYIKSVSKVGVPWYNVMGNHDMNSDAKADSLTDETFTANFGPANYAYNYGKAHFLILEDNLYPDPGHKGFRGGLTESQFKFVENDLKLVDTSRLVVMAFHVPLQNGYPGSYREEDRDHLFRILEKYPHVLVLSAHSHNQRQELYGKEYGWTNEKRLYEYNVGTTCGNWWSGKVNEQGVIESDMSDGTPKGYSYLNINGNQYTADYKVAGMPASYQINLYHRKVMNDVWWEGRGHIYANFFMGHKDSKVEYRIDDKPWKPMKFVGGADPAFVAKGAEWDTADTLMRGRRPTEAGNCTHLWNAPLPENIGLGEHKIEVRATDVFGRTFTQTSSYRIEKPKW
ncbi:calcineurin-like phosphoesterase family protein [Dyadobacter sp. LJ53]|uniref:calcineurin-like phosphoesterase C-terminal domain-containing protein n=1 Tax=Dyadobacter chenwenxiniae TaxID=2906456 RepID=UPI001F392360|nr:calcineurin-like phosphoesterase family protein [Dyadobacter chenwenxiniae]MCF0052491.1 calcineurin-like phosphoesterase family protein [Dyadobacter chenwenxiniae]